MAELDELPQGDDDLDISPDEISVEARARTMGWKPKEQFRGDPRQHIDAAAFIEKGERELPILRDQNRRMSEKLVKFETDMGALSKTIEEQGEAVRNAMQMARGANEAGYNRAIAELKAKQREAAASGDIEAFDQIDEQITAAQKERAATVDDTANHVTTVIPKPAAPPAQPQLDPETTDFIAANPWFNAKPVLNNAMVAAHASIQAREGIVKGAALADQYERAKAEVIEAFPHFFPNEAPMSDDNPTPAPTPRPRPRLSPALDPTGQRPNRSAKSPFDQIEDPAERAEARKAYDGIKRWDEGATEEEYVTLYLNPKLNPIELREQRNKKAH